MTHRRFFFSRLLPHLLALQQTPRRTGMPEVLDQDAHELSSEEERQAYTAATQNWPQLEKDVRAAIDDQSTAESERQTLRSLLETYQVGRGDASIALFGFAIDSPHCRSVLLPPPAPAHQILDRNGRAAGNSSSEKRRESTRHLLFFSSSLATSFPISSLKLPCFPPFPFLPIL